jgi:integrase
MNTVTWDNLICTFIQTGCAATVERKLRELGNKRWDKLKNTPIQATTGTDLLELLKAGGTKTYVYLGTLQKLAIEVGLLPLPILPKRMWPKPAKSERRAITEEEHRRLGSNLGTTRWKTFLEILWETGAAQSDAANFRIEELAGGVVTYNRMKTGVRAAQELSPELQKMLASVAAGRTSGYFLPSIQRMDSKDRATIFRRKCHTLGIKGVTLHSYRYAWAERAFSAGMPERLAMVALGHNSAAIHRVYAKNAKVVAPSIAGFAAATASQSRPQAD